MMNKILLGLALLLLPSVGSAQTGCVLTSGAFVLEKPITGVTRFSVAANCQNRNWEILSSSITLLGPGTTAAMETLLVTRIGALSNTDITISSAVTFISSVTLNSLLHVIGDATFINDVSADLFVQSGSLGNTMASIALSRSGAANDTFPDLYGTSGDNFLALGGNVSGIGEVAISRGSILSVGTTFYVVDGRVGINNTSPLSTLDVAGNFAVSGASVYGGSVTVNAASLFTGAHTIPDDTVTTSKIKDDSVTSAKLLQQPESLLKVSGGVMTSDGTNIGIGSGATTPAATLEIDAGISGTDPFLVGVSSFIIKANGNVGIGSSDPATTLELKSGSSGHGLRLENTGSGGRIYDIKVFSTLAGRPGLFSIIDALAGVDRFSIIGGGNVGINEIVPEARLEVKASVEDQFVVQFSSQNGTSHFLVDRLGAVRIAIGHPLDWGDANRKIEYVAANVMTMTSAGDIVLGVDSNNNGTNFFAIQANTQTPDSGGNELFRITEGNIMRLQPNASAPGTCTIGDFYVDTSGAYCGCTASNTWSNFTGTGSCS